jgi:hypothetical protein
MKIISQDSNQMALKDGNIAGGVFIGIIMVGVSGYWAYYLLTAPGQQTQIAWIAGIIALVGLIVIFATSSISVTIDKSQGRIAFNKKRIIGGTAQAQNIADAVRIELRRGSYETTNSNQQGFSMNGGRQVMESQTVILFKDGTEMPLENMKKRSGGSGIIGVGVMMAGEGKERLISQQVATFIGVPFEEMGSGAPQINIGGTGGGISL